MSSDLNVMDALKLLAQEKGIDEYDMLDKLEQSLAATYQRILDLENRTRVTIDRETGRIYVYELVPVGEVDEETGEAESYDERDVTLRTSAGSPHRTPRASSRRSSATRSASASSRSTRTGSENPSPGRYSSRCPATR